MEALNAFFLSEKRLICSFLGGFMVISAIQGGSTLQSTLPAIKLALITVTVMTMVGALGLFAFREQVLSMATFSQVQTVFLSKFTISAWFCGQASALTLLTLEIVQMFAKNRKTVYPNELNQLAIVQPRELSRGPKTDFSAHLGIQQVLISAPFFGKITALPVQEGDFVEQGAHLCTLEALKMEHRILAPSKGKIIKMHAALNTYAKGTLFTIAQQ